MRLARFAFLAAVLSLACAEGTLHVESDTTWSGTVQGAAVQGVGDRTFDLDGGRAACWSFTKTGPNGVLRVYAEDQLAMGLGTDIVADQSTTEPGGVITGCLR